MRWPRYSLRKLLLFTAMAAGVSGFSAHRIHTSRSGRLATYQIWSLDGRTVGSNSDAFVSPYSELSRISLTMNHGFWGDLIGFDHTTAILLPENEYNSPIDAEWLGYFESAIRNLPHLKVVFVERDDITDNMINEINRKFSHIQFKRLVAN